MSVHAFKMQLKPGVVAEYRKRHGIHDYSIFLDEETLSLFAVLKLREDNSRDSLPDHPIMKRWWDYMAPLMEVQPSNQPKEWPLSLLFHMD
ncbi:MAG: L-rhamnose mutarotase [Sphingobium sp.]|nr:MAG: L-rhamnose mutarotase [Sphingobium sp.]